MGVTGQLIVTIDIKEPGVSGDVFHELLGSRPHHLPNIAPDKVHGCEVHEGDFGEVGSVIEWDYTVDGEKCVARQKVEAIDEENKMVRFKMIEGSDMLKYYKTFIVTVHVIIKDGIDAIKWVMDYESFEDIGPYPTALMDLAIVVTRDIEAHHAVNA